MSEKKKRITNNQKELSLARVFYEAMTPVTTRDVLGLAGVSISLRDAQKWSAEMRKQAADWAYTTYMKENCINVAIPQRPVFLNEFIDQGRKQWRG
jgi:hypothetical protein